MPQRGRPAPAVSAVTTMFVGFCVVSTAQRRAGQVVPNGRVSARLCGHKYPFCACSALVCWSVSVLRGSWTKRIPPIAAPCTIGIVQGRHAGRGRLERPDRDACSTGRRPALVLGASSREVSPRIAQGSAGGDRALQCWARLGGGGQASFTACSAQEPSRRARTRPSLP